MFRNWGWCCIPGFVRGYVNIAGLVIVFFTVDMIEPHSIFGKLRYSAPLVESHDSVDQSGWQLETSLYRETKKEKSFLNRAQRLGEDAEGVLDGRVYRIQYVPPVSGQSGQGGVTAPTGEGPQRSSPTVVPFITISQRYDDNILYSPNKVYDFVTNVSPGARWNFESNFFDGSMVGAMNAEYYVRNPGLSYVGVSGGLSARLDNMFGHVVRGWSVRVSDSFVYSPQQSAFLSSEAGNQVPVSVVRGIQTFRSNSLSNIGEVVSTLPLAPDISFLTTYSNQILRFFSKPDPNLQGALFDSTNQLVSAGPEYRLSPNYSIGMVYVYQDMAFAASQASGSPPPSGLTTQGGMLTWRGRLSPLISAELGGGGSVVLPENSAVGTGRALLQYTTPELRASFLFTRMISPSFFLVGGAMINDLMGASVSYTVTAKWSVTGSYNYSHGNMISGPSFRFDSRGPTGSVNYQITPYVVASGTVTYFQTLSVSPGSPVYEFNRTMLMLSVRGEWN